MKLFETPILFLVFNRPEETEAVFNTIRNIAPKYLYIAADGPRQNKEGESTLCENVKEIVKNVDWHCEVKTLFREKNLGCRIAVSEAITWFFKDVEQGIILEDDCLPDPSFFRYCADLLEKYRHNENIISIGGTNLGYSFSSDNSYGFSRFMNMWGWATWRRSVQLVDYEMKYWNHKWNKNWFLHRKLQAGLLPIDYNWIKHWKNYFNLTASGKIDTWDFQWIFTQLRYNKLSVFPSKNLVRNIGFSNTATHTFHPGHNLSFLNFGSTIFPLTAPLLLHIDQNYENDYIKKIWFPYKRESLFRIIRSDILNAGPIAKITGIFKKRNNYF